MRNSNPKSEMAAMKEKAAKEKDKQARRQSTEKERVEKTRGTLKAGCPRFFTLRGDSAARYAQAHLPCKNKRRETHLCYTS